MQVQYIINIYGCKTYHNSEHNTTNINWTQQYIDKVYDWKCVLQIFDIPRKSNDNTIIFTPILNM